MSLRARFRRKVVDTAATASTTTSNGCTVIQVAKVEAAKNALPEVPSNLAVDALLSPSAPPTPGLPATTIEACSGLRKRLVAGVQFHPGVAAIHLAFNDHRPLVLSPDIIWMFVVQGVANHVNVNERELRPKLVRHLGKFLLTVRRDDFVKGSPDNPWPDAFDEFAAQIREHIGDSTHELLLPRFSTTGPAERAAAQVVLLDAMQSYFEYEFQTLCGIPQVTLTGTAADWLHVEERVKGFGRFGLEWWTECLLPIIDQFVAASRGRADAQFWNSIYKINGGSGGPYVSGWITAFFPYLMDRDTGLATNRNGWLVGNRTKLKRLLEGSEDNGPFPGITTESFPSGLSKVPLRWTYLNVSHDMELLAGFIGVRQDPETLALRPEIGWAVHDPSSRTAILSARMAERARLADERQRLASEKAQSWIRKGMCPKCNGWIYLYTETEEPVHCGAGLVNVTARNTT